jgi:rhamnogalacturonyl hydrolase YesR
MSFAHVKPKGAAGCLIACLVAIFSCNTTRAAVPSDQLTPPAVLETMKAVADWQLAQPPTRHRTDDWTYGALYTGIMALDQVADSSKYHDAMIEMGKQHEWKPARRPYHADDHCVSQTYIELYYQNRDPQMIAPTLERFDFILANQSTSNLNFSIKGSQTRWSWCDALFMSPPAWLRLYLATGNKEYINFMDREWRATSDYLYDTDEHLYFRDSTYFERREANGTKVFWSRGNGWVMGGLARVLQVMPPEHPTRKFYLQQYKEMAAKILSIQQPDGLWRASLLDPASYPLKETSGSGFFTFALTWGVNRGILDRAEYEPAVKKAWQGLVSCVTPEGKLQNVQPVGANPKAFDPTHSDVYGVGAFLLAGSEIYRMLLAESPAAAYGAFMPQRKDDFAWENDRIAFRMYGPALERTGEISSGIDVWCKRTRVPVIERWFFKADYHKDHGEGLDFYKVGPSRGCGATGVYQDEKLAVANNFVTYKIIENGPQRAVFELGYAPYEAAGVKVTETRRITLETGSNLNLIETRFDWEGGPNALQVAVGLVKQSPGSATEVARNRSWMATWEPQSGGNGELGCAVKMPGRSQFVDTPQHALLVTKLKRGQTLRYHAGAGWSRSGDYSSKADWVRYVSQFSGR